MISTRDLSQLPDIDALRRLMQSLAVLDAILSPEWDVPVLLVQREVVEGRADGVDAERGRGRPVRPLHEGRVFHQGVRSRGGDVTPYRERPKRVWPGVLDSVPKAFAKSLSQPAFSMDDTTFCVWRLKGDRRGRAVTSEFPKGERPGRLARRCSATTTANRTTYRKHAEDYFEAEVPLKLIRACTLARTTHRGLVQAIKPEMTLADLKADLKEDRLPVR